ncbi:hypothetical protein DSO57_1013151 [Entomophthora muscae]|uniref:Uncharacterized protein n=1 Tax=Entomophthora muscae TaxID=34485 RepID=A0ACC2TGP0_9FUNG|nr:hypothetical protein DSO57_1013151 [Entomophthora muscae]
MQGMALPNDQIIYRKGQTLLIGYTIFDNILVPVKQLDYLPKREPLNRSSHSSSYRPITHKGSKQPKIPREPRELLPNLSMDRLKLAWPRMETETYLERPLLRLVLDGPATMIIPELNMGGTFDESIDPYTDVQD